VRREILVNETPPETRVALTEDDRAVEVFHQRRRQRGLVGNVYLGRVRRVLPGMHAAFVSIGLDRDAFLYVEDVLPRAVEEAEVEPEEPSGEAEEEVSRPRIEELVKEGQEIVVQVTKDPLAGKGPRVSANLSLPGHRLVYLPRMRGAAVSRRIAEEGERERLRGVLEGLTAEGGFIARTAAQGASSGDFEAERRYLTELAARIERKGKQATAPSLLHRELDLALRVVRDLASADVAAIRVDEETTHARLEEFLSAVAPGLVSRLELYSEQTPLFERFGVEQQIEDALASRLMLPSGGSVVLHQTEALVAIDVNTGKFVGSDGLEDTVFATNLEAIPEIARQIRLRDLGGLLVVDFIDMQNPAHRRKVFERFEAELAKDRARTRVLQISEFGLVEITRQRARWNLERTLTRVCPECEGTGRVKTDLTVALDIRRALVKAAPLYDRGETIRVLVRPSLARMVEAEEPDLFADLVKKLGLRIELVSDPALPQASFELLPR
jgi:ribonuclease G